MGRSNYSFQKRQKELARKKKKEEKRLRKLAKGSPETQEDANESLDDAAQTDRVESGLSFPLHPILLRSPSQLWRDTMYLRMVLWSYVLTTGTWCRSQLIPNQ
jgi:hypothetical protein